MEARLALKSTVTETRPMLAAPWDAHIARHHHRVLVELLAYGIGLERAQELAQDVWVQLMQRHAEGALPRLDFPGLALAQGRFLALADLRRTRRSPEAPAESLAEHMPGTEMDPEARLLSKEALKRVLTALTKENPRARQVFDRIYDDPGVPHARVAAEIGLSVQRVRQTLCEVRRRLRKALEEQAP